MGHNRSHLPLLFLLQLESLLPAQGKTGHDGWEAKKPGILVSCYSQLHCAAIIAVRLAVIRNHSFPERGTPRIA